MHIRDFSDIRMTSPISREKEEKLVLNMPGWTRATHFKTNGKDS
jgi:hypothetical protein